MEQNDLLPKIIDSIYQFIYFLSILFNLDKSLDIVERVSSVGTTTYCTLAIFQIIS